MSPQLFLSTLSLRRATVLIFDFFNAFGIFLSTLSLRRATAGTHAQWPTQQDFYPRSPCGERRGISSGRAETNNFYPRSPCGERPTSTHRERQEQHISIHALLAESDGPVSFFNTVITNFYPRSPCGERRQVSGDVGHTAPNFYPRSPCGERRNVIDSNCNFSQFLSTLSLRRATF